MTWKKTRLWALALGLALVGMQSAALAQSGSDWPEPQCRPTKLYDIIISTFHQSVVQMNDGSWKVWGEQGTPENNNNALSPVSINLGADANGAKALLVTAGSSGPNNVQNVVLGNDGAFYAWGNCGVVLNSAHACSSGTQAISKTSLTLPAGVTAADVVMLTGGYKFLAIVTADGAAYVLNSSDPNLLGSGQSSSNNNWNRVQTAADVNLQNVIALRAFINSSGKGAAIALTKNGDGDRKLYTWGTFSRSEGSGTGTTVHNYATELTQPSDAVGKPKMIGVTGYTKATSDASAFFVLYTSDPDSFDSYGTLYAMGRNNEKQLGDFGTASRNTWAALKKPVTFNSETGLWSYASSTMDNVRMFSVQEHDAWDSDNANTGSGALIVQNGDVWSWGGNNGAMIGGKIGGGSNPNVDLTNNYTAEGVGGLDPAIRGFLMRPTMGHGKINARYIEMGGHTTAFLPNKKPQYCYVGHQIRGSMGDGTNATVTNKWQTQCEGTAALMICGSEAIKAVDDAPNPIAVPDVAATVGNAYLNDQFQGTNITTTELLAEITGEVLTPATPINWGPVPYLDTETGDIMVPGGTTPGTYTIEYRIRDAAYPNEIFDDATITVVVSGIRAIPDTALTPKNTPVTTDVLANDSAGDGELDPTSVTVVSNPNSGTVSCNNAGQCTYTPTTGFTGTDTYTYRVCLQAPKNTECDTTTVTVAVGEPPTVAAYPDASITTVDVPARTPVLANDVAVGGTLDPNSVELVGSGPENAEVYCDEGFCTLISDVPGTYNYTYKVCMAAPNTNTCAQSTVTVVVSGVSGDDDTPTPAIVAAPDFGTTPPDTSVTTTVVQNDRAVGGTVNPGSVTPTQNPANGGVTCQDGSCTYTPNPGFIGTDTYTYQVCLTDPATTCSTTTVTIKVGNPAVQAANDSGTVTGTNPVTTNVLANDRPTGGELNPSSVTVITPPAKGTATPNHDGTITYTPNPDFSGTDEYTYQVCLQNPKEVCATAKVTITEGQPPAADLYTELTLPNTAQAGGNATALITFGNQGDLPGGVTGDKYKVTGLPTGLEGVRCDGATCNYNSATGEVIITGLPDTLAPGQKHPVLLHWTVPSTAPENSQTTLQSQVFPADSADPTSNNTAQASLTVGNAETAANHLTDTTTTVVTPATAAINTAVIATATYVNLGSFDAVGMTYKIRVQDAAATPEPTVAYQGQNCTKTGNIASGSANEGAFLSDCGLPNTLQPGQSLEVEVTYTAPSAPRQQSIAQSAAVRAAAPGDVQVYSTVNATNDNNPANNDDDAPTVVIIEQLPDVTTTVAPPTTIVAGSSIEIPVTFSNVGSATATGVTYQVTLSTGLTNVSCSGSGATCAYDPATGAVTVSGLPETLNVGQQEQIVLRYDVPLGGVPSLSITSQVNAANELEPQKGNNSATATTSIVTSGQLIVTKSIYEGHDGGAQCGTSVATKKLQIVEKNPTTHNITWCFAVQNTGTEYLSQPAWNDHAPQLQGMTPTLRAGSTLPLAPGATATWYIESAHNRSVVNTVDVEMRVTDPNGTPITGVLPATGRDTVETIFAMIYDPPFGVKIGEQNGQQIIRWTMVWLNDNPISADNVLVSDVIRDPMSYINDGTLVCRAEGGTTVHPGTCLYNPSTRTVSVRADFAPDFGRTVVTAQNRLFISFNVVIPTTVTQVENQGVSDWTPTDANGNPQTPLSRNTTFIAGLAVGPLFPATPGVPVVTPPPGVAPNDPSLGSPGPGAPAPAPTPIGPPSARPEGIPVDNPLALLILALGLMGLMARRRVNR